MNEYPLVPQHLTKNKRKKEENPSHHVVDVLSNHGQNKKITLVAHY